MTGKASKNQMRNAITMEAIEQSRRGDTIGSFDNLDDLMEELSSVGEEQEEMDYHVQRLGPDISALLYGCEGMLFAADQYCEDREQLELSDYLEWMASHGIRARLYVRNWVKGILYRRQLKKIVESLNGQLQERGALLTVDESSPEMIELLTMVQG